MSQLHSHMCGGEKELTYVSCQILRGTIDACVILLLLVWLIVLGSGQFPAPWTDV